MSAEIFQQWLVQMAAMREQALTGTGPEKLDAVLQMRASLEARQHLIEPDDYRRTLATFVMTEEVIRRAYRLPKKR
jgi:hypothetical protein